MDIGIGGLNYIALGVGLTCASQVLVLSLSRVLVTDFSQVNARYMDRIYIWLKQRQGNGLGEPEFRLRTSHFMTQYIHFPHSV